MQSSELYHRAAAQSLSRYSDARSSLARRCRPFDSRNFTSASISGNIHAAGAVAVDVPNRRPAFYVSADGSLATFDEQRHRRAILMTGVARQELERICIPKSNGLIAGGQNQTTVWTVTRYPDFGLMTAQGAQLFSGVWDPNYAYAVLSGGHHMLAVGTEIGKEYCHLVRQSANPLCRLRLPQLDGLVEPDSGQPAVTWTEYGHDGIFLIQSRRDDPVRVGLPNPRGSSLAARDQQASVVTIDHLPIFLRRIQASEDLPV